MSDGSSRRLSFRVEYDGTDYHGWQRQPTGLPTLQQTLEEAVSATLGEAASVDGASRTDAGVHARDQLAAVTVRHPIRPSGLVKALNTRLPPGVAIRDATEEAADFAPRFGNRGKTYHYRFYLGQERRPLVDRYAWRLPWRVDPEALAPAAAPLLGTHDFTSFAASGGGHENAVRTLERIELLREPHDVFVVAITGTAFLKQMVRNLVGTLMDACRTGGGARGVAAALAARDRRAAGQTAPARGLTLERVHR